MPFSILDLRGKGAAAVLFLTLLVVAGLARTWRSGAEGPGTDFYQYWATGQLGDLQDREEFYTEAGRLRIGEKLFRIAETRPDQPHLQRAARIRRKFENFSSPLLNATFATLFRADYETNLALYRLLSLAALMGALAVFCRQWNYSLLGTLAAAALVLNGFEPLQSEMRVANFNELQLGLLAAYALLTRKEGGTPREMGEGVLLGLMIFLKATLLCVPALLLFSWAVRGHYRRLGRVIAGMALAALAALLLPSYWFGTPWIWRSWLESFGGIDAYIPLELGNISPVNLLFTASGINVGAAVGVTLFLAIAALLVRRARQGKYTQDERVLLALGCLIYLLSARLVWLHYLLLCLPAALLAARDHGRRPWVRLLAVAGITMLFLSFGGGGMVSVNEAVRGSLIAYAGIAALFVVGMTELC